ncbi:nucleoplasmin-2b [Anguilla rostrata]|uniref:nucleoplasmin-2b n=1 Tax=Anguilla anguilla TaxID=7936 RepID=UPI0015AB4468|nr:nucleoplasmin-2b [Anguilla anguilla]XP_035248118.1 nucleoplasmin-2b [Anguilla anguilla]
MSVGDVNKAEKPVSTLWGCELNENNRTGKFKTDDSKHQHQLALRTMCLGESAKDEFNIVELMTGEDESKAFPMATLRASGMPTVNLSGVDLHPPITFHLKYGSGPVYICGEHVALEDDYLDEEMDEEEELAEEEEEDIEESPPKPLKKPAAKNGAGKRKKPEEADEEGTVSDGENPPKKATGRGRKPAAKKV